MATTGDAGDVSLEQCNIAEAQLAKGLGKFFKYVKLVVDLYQSQQRKVKDVTAMMKQDELDMQSAGIIFGAYYQRMFRYILSMVRDTMEAEDLTQETLLRAYRHRNSLRDEGAQTAWLYRIATHVCLDRLRQCARRAPAESDIDLEKVDVAEPDTPSLQQVIERDEMSACVQQYLNRLSDSYRAVILLHDMHELTAMEIAQLLDESLATIKIRLHRARLKLRNALKAGCTFSYDECNVLTCESKE